MIDVNFQFRHFQIGQVLPVLPQFAGARDVSAMFVVHGLVLILLILVLKRHFLNL